MPRPKRRSGSVWGPYGPERGRKPWRIVVVLPGGQRTSRRFSSKRAAEHAIETIKEEYELGELTIESALEKYLAHMARKGSSTGHVKTTGYRLGALLPDGALCVVDVDRKRAQRLYDALADSGQRADTHRNTLGQCRTFWKWLVKRGHANSNPWTEVEGVGRRSRGKEQLTHSEARTLADHCAGKPLDAASRGALLALLCGLRASEIVLAEVRDLDDDGVLRVRGTKTAASLRQVRVPQLLRDMLDATPAARRTEPGALLVGGSRHSLRNGVRRLCREAGVTVVTPHGLRGTHASLATEAGASSELVAATLGHASTAVTERHYSTEQSQQARDQGRVLRVLQGGK